MMTTMAALLGTLPIAFVMGTGGEERRLLGSAVVGGPIVSQLLTLYTTPVIYFYLDPFQAKRREEKPERPGTAVPVWQREESLVK